MIVRPGSELVFVAIERPREAGARFRDDESERWIGNHVDPGLGRAQSAFENSDVLAAIFSEPAKSIEKLEALERRGYLLIFCGARGPRWRENGRFANAAISKSVRRECRGG